MQRMLLTRACLSWSTPSRYSGFAVEQLQLTLNHPLSTSLVVRNALLVVAPLPLTLHFTVPPSLFQALLLALLFLLALSPIENPYEVLFQAPDRDNDVVFDWLDDALATYHPCWRFPHSFVTLENKIHYLDELFRTLRP